MRIHLITNLFAPDQLAGAALYTDMAGYLEERGHEVRVTTTFPYYPAWELKPADKGIRLRDETHGRIPVRRIQMYIPRRVTGISRLLSDLSFLLSLLRRGVYRDWTPEVVITASPMLSQCIAQRFLYAGQAVPRLIIVQDFVVDAALELGILRMPLISKLLNGLQNWALRSAQTLSTISPQMLEKLKDKVGPDRDVVLIPNWIHQSLQSEIDRQLSHAPPRARNVLVYSGNFGIKQSLPHFLDQFRTALNSGLKWNLEIYGGGAEKSELTSTIAANPSVKLGGVQDESAYVSTLLRASACLVTQRSGVGANFLPSKLLPALATGTPVLAVCEPDSPLGREVAESACGEVVRPDDPAALLQVLQKWQDHPEDLAEMSRRATQRAALYERGFILGRYETELKKLTERPASSSPGRKIATAAETRQEAKVPPTESLFPGAMCLRRIGSILFSSGMAQPITAVTISPMKPIPFFKKELQLRAVLLMIVAGWAFSPLLHAQKMEPEAGTALAAQIGPGVQVGTEVETVSAVQDISNEPDWLDDPLAKGSPFHFGLTIGETYDDNILISPQKTSSFLTHISPSIDFQKGDQTSPHMNYLNIYFAPTFFLYQDHSNYNRNDYDADLYYQYSWTRLILGFEQRYQHLTDPNLDIGSLVRRDLYTTTFTGSYMYNSDLSFFGRATQQISSYPDLNINEWTIDSYALYRVAPKLLLGVGPRFSFFDISGAPNETQQDLLMRLRYTPGSKITLSFDGGVEYLQYQDNSPSHLLPIFDVNVTYVPQDGTGLYLTAGRETFNSFDFQGETVVDNSVQAGVNQRFLQNISFTVSAGYYMSNYEFGSGPGDGESGGPRRKDNYYFAKAGVEWNPNSWLKVEASYQRSENDSSFSQNTFNDNQIDVQSSVHF